MSRHDPGRWMWEEATTFLERAERMRREFFQRGGARGAAFWEPPVDLMETQSDIWVVVALPGVVPGGIHIMIEGDQLIVSGSRSLNVPPEARIHRLEIPHGRFERRIQLPPGRYVVETQEPVNGCLKIRLRKSA